MAAAVADDDGGVIDLVDSDDDGNGNSVESGAPAAAVEAVEMKDGHGSLLLVADGAAAATEAEAEAEASNHTACCRLDPVFVAAATVLKGVNLYERGSQYKLAVGLLNVLLDAPVGRIGWSVRSRAWVRLAFDTDHMYSKSVHRAGDCLAVCERALADPCLQVRLSALIVFKTMLLFAFELSMFALNHLPG